MVAHPKLFDVVPLKTEPSELPKLKHPYYLLAQEGLYLRNSNLIGEYFIKEKFVPQHAVESMGDWKGGFFRWTAPTIPRDIMGSVLDFFKKIFERDKTEAEVILLFNPETKVYKVHVPWQVCTGASVQSIYDPGDIPDEWVVVGTIHSHCDFSAFHSGTDSADASIFNGIHITIGHVNYANPSYAVMAVINEVEFEFKEYDSVIATDDIIGGFDCPASWLDFVVDKVHKIVDMEFKTLSKEQLTEFENSVRSTWLKPTKKDDKVVTPTWSGGRDWNDDDDYAWWYNRDNKKDDKIESWRQSSYLSNTRWNSTFKRSFPIEMLDSSGELKDDFIAEVLVGELEKLRDIANTFDLEIFYTIEDDILEVVKDDDDTEDKSALLLGPGEVIEFSNRAKIDDDDNYMGEEGFFRQINKILDESENQEEVDRRLAELIHGGA